MKWLVLPGIFIGLSATLTMVDERSQMGPEMVVAGYTCDAVSGTCNCNGFFSCKEMERMVCAPSSSMSNAMGAVNRSCFWKDATQVIVEDLGGRADDGMDLVSN